MSFLNKKRSPVRGFRFLLGTSVVWGLCTGSSLWAKADASAPEMPPEKDFGNNTPGAKDPSTDAKEARFFVNQYRVEGAGKLGKMEIEKAVYPFLGPHRTSNDVEKARLALEKAYQEKGYQAATVEISPAGIKNGVIVLQVAEGEVGRLRVKGSRYFSLDEIKSLAPSLKEGSVIDSASVQKDIMSLNQLPDRRVTPSLKAGTKPNTVDVDLLVEDTLPLHGSVELNNRYSPDTPDLRLNGAASYSNLWQMGHTIGTSFQIAPEDFEQVNVFSGYYMAPVPELSWLKLMLQGTRQDSNVSTIGGVTVAGRGEVIGPRAIFILPGKGGFYHSVTTGFDYKHFNQELTAAGVPADTPITYFPLSLSYSATWAGKGYETSFNGGVTSHFRGMGSSPEEFELNRFGADGSFIYFRGDLSHKQDLPGNLQLFTRVQGQVAGQPLISNEQFSAGGTDTVRGYLESEFQGDNAILGTMELRSPSLGDWLGKNVTDWRFHVFTDAGLLSLNESLPGQKELFEAASIGVGSRIRLFDHYTGSLEIGSPLIDGSRSQAQSLLLMFQLGADF